MLLHTILTAEQIFPYELATSTTFRQGDDFIECYEQDGKTYLSRVISTDPKKFLDKRFTIGGEFKL